MKSEKILVFKSFFLVEASMRSLKKLYEEPERFKIWDPNVLKTKLQGNMSGNKAKIYVKTLKGNESPCLPEI